MSSRRNVMPIALAIIGTLTGSPTWTSAKGAELSVTLLASGIQGGAGSTIGPDGALYVVERAAGTVMRIAPRTGRMTLFASGLPKSVVPVGGAMDVAFIGRTAYVLVTLVGPDVGGSDVVGLYRVDGRSRVSVVADIGQFSINHPPRTAFDVPSGVQYALEPYPGGFLVTDGHHNRVLLVTLDGIVSEVVTLDNVVPTGMAVSGRRVYVAQAGPTPHLPEDGRVVAFGPRFGPVREIASGGRLLVDVELGRRRAIFALAQGEFTPGQPPGEPAVPHTGALMRANDHGALRAVVTGLNQPTSFELIDDAAFVVTLGGEVWRIDGLGDASHRGGPASPPRH